MPYQNEIAIRLHSPKDYEYFRRKPAPSEHHWVQEFGEGNVDYVYGMDKKTKTLEIQAIRIRVKKPDQFSLEQIENYVKERDLKPIKIEMPKEYSKKGLFEMHDFELTNEPLHRPGVEYYCSFESENIESLEFDFLKHVLKVEFKSGVSYLYSSIPASVAQAFKYSVSKGQFFAQKIKNNGYPCKRID
jgi:hypothetical protein